MEVYKRYTTQNTSIELMLIRLRFFEIEIFMTLATNYNQCSSIDRAASTTTWM